MKSNQMKLGPFLQSLTTCGRRPGESDQKEQRVVAFGCFTWWLLWSVKFQMHCKILKYFMTDTLHFSSPRRVCSASLPLILFLFWQPDQGVNRLVFQRLEMCEMFSGFVIGLHHKPNEDVCAERSAMHNCSRWKIEKSVEFRSKIKEIKKIYNRRKMNLELIIECIDF